MAAMDAALFLLLFTGATLDLPAETFTLCTPSYAVTVQEQLVEYDIVPDNVRYFGINKKTGKSIALKGKALFATGADGVTPSHFIGYTFNNGNTTYFVGEDGELVVTRGTKTLIQEMGEWKPDCPP